VFKTAYKNFHSSTVHLDITKSFIYPTDAQLDCSKNNVKIYIKIYIKSAPTCFGLTNHHQGAYCLCFAEGTIIKNSQLNYVVMETVR
jgi:hypothetical protein